MIVDASVAAKWFLPTEELDAQAQLIRGLMLDDRLRVSAPSILWAEVAHAVVGAVRRNRFDEQEARSVSARFATVREVVDLAEIDPEEAVLRALSTEVGAYDAQYLILARRLDASVITADRRLHERGRAHGYDVVWLGDITLRDGVLVDTPPGYQ